MARKNPKVGCLFQNHAARAIVCVGTITAHTGSHLVRRNWSLFIPPLTVCVPDWTTRPESAGIPNRGFLRHLNDDLLDLGRGEGTAGPALSAAIVFLGNVAEAISATSPVSRWCYLPQKLPSQSFGSGGQPTPLVIAETQTSLAQLFT